MFVISYNVSVHKKWIIFFLWKTRKNADEFTVDANVLIFTFWSNQFFTDDSIIHFIEVKAVKNQRQVSPAALHSNYAMFTPNMGHFRWVIWLIDLRRDKCFIAKQLKDFFQVIYTYIFDFQTSTKSWWNHWKRWTTPWTVAVHTASPVKCYWASLGAVNYEDYTETCISDWRVTPMWSAECWSSNT